MLMNLPDLGTEPLLPKRHRWFHSLFGWRPLRR